MDSVRVFISYSHDNEQHEAWVLKLATDLRTHGVDVIFDQFDLRLGKDLRFFMENGLSSAALVVCICSEAYVQKVDRGIGGAGYEGMIMTQSLLKNVDMDYIIPVIRNNRSSRRIPLALGSKYYIDFSEDGLYFEKYKQLLAHIYGEDEKLKPRLGKNPFSSELGVAIDRKTKLEDILYQSPALDGHVKFRYDNHNHVYTLGTGEYAFNTRWSGCSNDAIYAYGRIGVKDGCTEYPDYENIIDFDFSSSTRTIRKGQVFVIENEYSHFAAIKLGSVKSSSHGCPYDEMEFDYHIYKGDFGKGIMIER